MTSDLSDVDVILNALEFDTNWLIRASNADPHQFIGQEKRLYAIMNKIQFITSRFAKVHNQPDPFNRGALREVLKS